MPRAVTYSVVDLEKWLLGKQERSDQIRSDQFHGSHGRGGLRGRGWSKNIAVTGDAQDPEAVIAAIASRPKG